MACRRTGGQGGFLPQRTLLVVAAAAVAGVPAAVHASWARLEYVDGIREQQI